MAPGKITLYHGGHAHKLEGILESGLNAEREFFLTPHKILAEEASNPHWPHNQVLAVDLPLHVFQKGIDQGILEIKDYLGAIPVEGCKEVVAKAEEGVDLINRYLWKYFRHRNES